MRNVSPWHVPHLRSLQAVHCAVMRWPTPHILHAVHLRSSSAVGSAMEYCGHGHSDKCVLQTRLREAVGSPDSYSSASHVVTGAHGSPFTASEYVPPTARGLWLSARSTHAAHSRFAMRPPFVSWPEPTAHRRFDLHDD